MDYMDYIDDGIPFDPLIEEDVTNEGTGDLNPEAIYERDNEEVISYEKCNSISRTQTITKNYLEGYSVLY